MRSHPVDLMLRFLLELAAWAAIGYWGWTQHEGPWRLVLGIGLPLLAMALTRECRILTDERDAREFARHLKIPVSGALGVLVRPIDIGSLGLEEAVSPIAKRQWSCDAHCRR